jgi:hypothetical protein
MWRRLAHAAEDGVEQIAEGKRFTEARVEDLRILRKVCETADQWYQQFEHALKKAAANELLSPLRRVCTSGAFNHALIGLSALTIGVGALRAKRRYDQNVNGRRPISGKGLLADGAAGLGGLALFRHANERRAQLLEARGAALRYLKAAEGQLKTNNDVAAFAKFLRGGGKGAADVASEEVSMAWAQKLKGLLLGGGGGRRQHTFKTD